MSRQILESIFPLPLTPFEQFMLLDDTPEYPMTFVFHWLVRGQVNVAALESSLEQAIVRHPLLRCRIEKRKRQPVWVLTPVTKPSLRVVEHGTPLWDNGGEYLDLSTETGLRVWVRRGKNTNHEIVFQFHHACCDGVGTFQFLTDVAVEYARQTGAIGFQQHPPLLEPTRLLTRNHPQHRRQMDKPPTWLQKTKGRIRETAKFFRQRPTSLHMVKRTTGSLQASTSKLTDRQFEGEPGIVSEVIGQTATTALRDVARRFDSSLNDLLIRELMLTLQAWNQKHLTSEGQPQRDLRVLVPTSLRGAGDHLMPATNVLSFAFITRRAVELENPEELLIGIANHTKAILKYRLGWMFLDGIKTLLQAQRFLPVGKAVFGNHCFATAIQSHLGKLVTQFDSTLRGVQSKEENRQSNIDRSGLQIAMGNLTIDQIHCAPPVRISTNAALATYTFDGRLYINLRCTPRKFSPDDSCRLLRDFAERLLATAADASTQQ